MDMSISALSNFMLHALTGGNQVKAEKAKEKKAEEVKQQADKERAEQQRMELTQDVRATEPGSMVDILA